MSSGIRAVCGVSALVLGLAACSDFTSSGDPLTDAEAAELAAVFAEEGFAGFEGVASPAQSPGANDEADARVTLTINDSGPCDGGGTATIAGTVTADIDEQAGTGTLEFEYTLTPTNCVFTTEGDKVFTISGDPNLKASGNMDLTETSLEGQFNYEGKFSWTEGSRAGACGVNIQVNYDFTFGGTTLNGSASVTGEVCGVTVNRTITIQDV